MESKEFQTVQFPRKMRRGECSLPREETERILRDETWGMLTVHGDGGFPYGVPMNYVWDNGTILLHATSENSHRLDALRRDSKVCFTVVPEHALDRERWTTIYKSVIVFGTAEIILEPKQRRAAMRTFMNVLSPEKTEEALCVCPPETARLVMIRITPIVITGKQGG